jgi:hypothetical protein
VNGFLLDENLPHRLRFQPSLPIHHSADVGEHSSDAELWEYAKTKNLVIGKCFCPLKNFNKALAMGLAFDNLSLLRFIAWRHFCLCVRSANHPFYEIKS